MTVCDVCAHRTPDPIHWPQLHGCLHLCHRCTRRLDNGADR